MNILTAEDQGTGLSALSTYFPNNFLGIY